MSDNMVQLQNNDGEKTSVNPSQSVWIAHWTTPTCNSANLLCCNLQEVLREISSSAKRSQQEGEARTYNMAEDNSLGSRKIDREERLDFQPFPMFGPSKKRKSSLAQNNDQATSGHIRALTSRFHYKSEHLKSILAGEASSESEKELKRSQLLPSQTAIASTLKKTGEREMKTVLPGKNHKFHHLRTSVSKASHMKIQSTIQSLDDVCFHADLNHTKSMACTYDSFEQLLSSQWIGHFKINSSKFANCTPKSRKREATSNETTNEFISKIMSTSSEPTSEQRQYVLMAFNQTKKTFEKKKVSCSGMERQIQETAFSDHPWISRWRVSRDAFLLEKPKATSVCDPQCSKRPLDQTQIEQFSRIASMAMMGKTMTRKYSSLRRGSTQVWNMEGF